MELDFFISQSSSASSSEKDKWLETSNVETRSFVPNKSYTIEGLNGDSDFSIFFTLDKKTRNKGCLISNVSENGGFSINFNDNNKIFVHSHYPFIDCHTFEDIDLSKKNCLGITKINNSILILNYDIQAKQIYQKSSYTFNQNSKINGDNYKIGYNSKVYDNIKISGISGLFDQMVCFSGAISPEEAPIIFSGFLPLTKNSTTSYDLLYSTEEKLEIKKDSILSQEQANSFIPFLNYISSEVIPISTGNYICQISGATNYITNKISWTGYYGSGENIICNFTGIPKTTGNVYNNYVGGKPVTLFFKDDIYCSMNDNSERLISHMFSFYPVSSPETDDFFSFNILNKYRDETVNTLVESDSSYKSGFYMNGVCINKKYCSLLKHENKNFSEIGISLPFDIGKKLFMKVDGFSIGYNLYWGFEKINSYDISGIYITTNQVDVDKNYQMIFDKSNVDPNYIHSNFGFATGDYAKGTCIVLGGDTVQRNSFRMDKKDIIQTSLYSLMHGKKDKVNLINLSPVFENSLSNWSDSMQEYIGPENPII